MRRHVAMAFPVLVALGGGMGLNLFPEGAGATARGAPGDESPRYVVAAAFAPDGKRLLTCESTQHLTLWDLNRRPAELMNPDHDKAVWSRKPFQSSLLTAAFSPNGKQVFAAGDEGVIKILDATSGEELRTLEPLPKMAGALFLPDGETFVTSHQESVAVRKLKTGESKHILPLAPPDEQFPGLAMTVDGVRLLTWADYGPVKEWDLTTGKLRHTLVPPKQKVRIRSATYLSDNATVQVSEDGFTRKLIDVKSGRLVDPPEGFKGFVGDVFPSPDGKRCLALAYAGGTAEMRGAATGKVQKPLPHYGILQRSSHDGKTISAPGLVLFSPDGKDMLLAGQRFVLPTDPPKANSDKDGRAVLLWDVEADRLRAVLAYPGNLP